MWVWTSTRTASELRRPNRAAAARVIGKVTQDVNKLLKVLARIGTTEQLHIVYEAGPIGFDCNAR